MGALEDIVKALPPPDPPFCPGGRRALTLVLRYHLCSDSLCGSASTPSGKNRHELGSEDIERCVAV